MGRLHLHSLHTYENLIQLIPESLKRGSFGSEPSPHSCKKLLLAIDVGWGVWREAEGHEKTIEIHEHPVHSRVKCSIETLTAPRCLEA